MADRRPDREAVPRVAIVGCGKIGSELDESAPDGPALTHASAWTRAGAELVALADPRPERLAAAGRARGVTALYASHDALFASTRVDIASLCTPTSLRWPVVEAALAAGVRVLFLEKPVAGSLDEAERIAAAARARGAIVAVNYLRRWDPRTWDETRAIHRGELGRVEHAVVYYGKGIVNNGTHAIDLLRAAMGDVVRVTALRRVADDMPDLDPTLDVQLELSGPAGDATAYLIAADHRDVSLFELDVVAQKGRTRIWDKGFTLVKQSVEDDPMFAGYKRLGAMSSEPTDFGAAFVHAARELVSLARAGTGEARCTLDDGLQALRVAHAAIASHRTRQSVALAAPAKEGKRPS